MHIEVPMFNTLLLETGKRHEWDHTLVGVNLAATTCCWVLAYFNMEAIQCNDTSSAANDIVIIWRDSLYNNLISWTIWPKPVIFYFLSTRAVTRPGIGPRPFNFLGRSWIVLMHALSGPLSPGDPRLCRVAPVSLLGGFFCLLAWHVKSHSKKLMKVIAMWLKLELVNEVDYCFIARQVF
jgi:hypothetical protein